MQGPTNESVGEQFQKDLLQTARDKTLQVILAVRERVKPGLSEGDAKTLLLEIQTQMGAPKSWHPPQIRFGENTLLPFGKKGIENAVLKGDDIFFLDIGPVFDGHEGDVGRTFALGNDSEMQRCCLDAERIWQDVRDYWSTRRASGRELYKYAESCAESRGWRLNLEKANGHRVADFPHAARIRGSIENWEQAPAADRWILEIQIRHPERPFGAFYEDLLT